MPVHPDFSNHLPDAAGKAGEDKRREMPDRFFGTELSQAAARKAASDREGERNQFAGAKRGETNQDAHDHSRVGTVDESRQEGTFERQVGGLVIERQTGGDAKEQQDAQAQGERQTLAPGAVLGDQEVPEPPKSNENGRRGRHDGELEEQRCQQ